jgi:protein-arginine kinase activator protein McsA
MRNHEDTALRIEAAAEIERLRLERGTVVHMSAEIERLRAALQEIVDVEDYEDRADIARRALESKP